MTEQDIARYRDELERRRRRLLEVVESSAEARGTVELDQTRVGRLSRMGAMQSQAMAIETDRRRQLELRRIEAALARIASGEYGDCARCGEPIAPKRLELDPATPVCIDCLR